VIYWGKSNITLFIFFLLTLFENLYTQKVSHFFNFIILDSDSKKLRIFDDARGKGVVINGLEEALVKTADDVLALLQKGSVRRQSAATRMNEHSR